MPYPLTARNCLAYSKGARTILAQSEVKQMPLIKQLRAAQGLSQRDLARRVGCSGAHISDVENGREMPSLRLLHRIAQELNVPDTALLADISEHKDSLAQNAPHGVLSEAK